MYFDILYKKKPNLVLPAAIVALMLINDIGKFGTTIVTLYMSD